MILDTEVIVKVNNRYLRLYEELGYGKLKQGDFINLSVNNLPKNSSVIVNVECDFCKNKKIIKYMSYIENIKNGGKYCCKICTPIQYKETCLKLYGVDNTSKLSKIHDKIKQTNLVRYGETSYAKTVEFKQNHKKQMIEKHGVDSFSKTEDFIIKQKETSIKKYGVENASQCPYIFSKQQKGRYSIHKHDLIDLYYQGSYEKDFIDNYYDKVEIAKPNSINFIFDNKNKVYHPDFYLPKYNLIVEIKSSYTYYKYMCKNISKQKETVNQGFDHIFIIDKNYIEFNKIIYNL